VSFPVFVVLIGYFFNQLIKERSFCPVFSNRLSLSMRFFALK
jgi:hypothetical protein